MNGIDHTGESGSVTVDVRESLEFLVFSRPDIDEDDIFELFVTGAKEKILDKKRSMISIFI